ncbi:iron-containing alcohol dehydrogenase [Pontibacter liquoris]|uniref:iron-containing alcohol dehydrogenase n=1 Tax=Pontibacter liquoris TaxID=2905677 RepID=UPI001FA7F15D|nr:iron-containing alcohol dehydrogenase [Pontibacter liquoris]
MYNNVYVIGVFDLFHKGHIALLSKAKSLGKRLIVAVNGDEMVAEYKRKPFHDEQDRLEMIKACKYVDEAFIIRGYDNKAYLEKYKIDAIVHGDDWERKSYLQQIRVTEAYLKSHQIDMVLVPYTSGISTTSVIEQIKGNKPCQNKSIQLPTIFQVNENIIDKLPVFLKINNVPFKKILVVSGSTSSLKYAEIILASLPAASYIAYKNDENTVEAIKEYCLSNKIDLLIGVGGGSILDVVKRVSLLADIENLLVPTIISNDGLVSPIAVIKDQNDQTLSLPGKTPYGVVVDINIIRNSPVRFLQAAAGDILSNISATNDWVLAAQTNGETINDLAYMLSRSAAFGLLHHESKDIKNRNFLKQVVYCQINSGLSMALAGTSRPCSGSEHLISHAIDYYNFSENTLHGLQVGSISIFCLYLQKKLDAKCINYAQELNIPLAFHLLDDKLTDKLSLIYDTSFKMRPGRFTILDTCKGMKFEDLYSDFLTFLERFKVYDTSYQLS